jgi:HK97 family phage major capsid protein
MRAFEAFKITNDERLAQIEQQISADVVTTEKLERINRAIDQHKALVDQLTLKAARPPLGASGFRASGAVLQHKAAFEAYVRHGETGVLHLLEEKALSVGSGPDGGYLVPAETEAAVIRGVKNISPIRAIAGNRTVSASVYKKPFAITGPATGWVAETATRRETNSPTLAELTFPTMELYTMPSATQALLDDSVVNIDEWLAEEIQRSPSPSRRAPPSSRATAETSRRASSPTPRSPTARGLGTRSAMSQPASTAISPTTTRAIT